MTDDHLAAFRNRFLDRCAAEAPVLEEIAARGDLASPELRRLAHSLAGAAGTFGYPRIGEPAARMDHAFAEDEAPDPTDLDELIGLIRQALSDRCC